MEAKLETNPNHEHHWVLAEPEAALTIGVCRNCYKLVVFRAGRPAASIEPPALESRPLRIGRHERFAAKPGREAAASHL